MYDQFKHFFNNDFSTYSEFLDQVLFPVFGKNNFEQGFDILTAEPEIQKKADDANINEIKHIGTISTELAADIKLFEVVVKDKCKIAHSRTKIQQLIRSYVGTFEGAFIVFHYQNTENRSWRFSYIEKRTSNSDSTTPKRYTYLFGKTFACRTAAERFKKLSDKNQKISLQDLTDAFSVEALSIEFFDKYRSIYADFIQFISGKRYEKEKGKWVEKVKHAPNIQFETEFKSIDKDVRDYVKKMMGRLVFLQFLEKKGWLGVPADKPWGEGNPNYMKQLFDNSDQKENFLEAVLEPLFFDTLNTERTNHLAKCILGDNIKIPYLNGGLFENDELDKKVVVFPAEYFNKLFEFFGEYNFTIDENDPNDAELGVDPEMLGRIFENLLEDNKDKGAYYTPKEIVHYMCQESLTEYLCTKLDIQNEVTERDAINQLLKNKIVNPILKPKIDELEKALDQVKICDPAIGSGAFPMGLLQEIFTIKGLIAHETGKEWNPAETKLNIIQNSIYGVDIEKGAVDIARLRFWLSLIVDDEEPRPLPNLDYKIVVGDSLISKFEGEVIEIDWELNEVIQTDLFGNENLQKRKQILEKLTEKQRSFFNPKHVNKKELEIEIRNLKIDVLINQLVLMIKTEKMEQPPIKNNFKDTKKFIKAEELFQKTECWRNTIRKLQEIKENVNAQFNHFDWKLDFPEVLNPYIVNEGGGFDIVIGNPPYLNFKMYSKENKNLYRQYYPEVFDGKADIYYYFFYKAQYIGRKNGIVSMITSRYWIEAEFAKKLRKNISSKTKLKEIVDFKNVTVFDGIGIKTCITSFFIFQKNIEYFYYRYHPGKKIGYIDLNEFVSNIVPIENFQSKDSWNLTDENSTEILKIIEEGSVLLEEIASCKQGIVTGLDKAFISTESEFKYLPTKLVKPWLKVGDIHKYSVNLVEKRELVYTKLIKSLDEYPELYERLLPFKNKLSNRREAKNKKIRWFDLQWPREQEFFESEKLICRFKASQNTFCYDNIGYYSSADTTVVALNENGKNAYSIKYLLTLLNSKVLSFYFKSYGKLMDYRYEYYPGPVGKLRIKNSNKQLFFIKISDLILYLKQQTIQIVYNQLIPDYFEELIDGMVYELYFPELLKTHNCEIIEHLGELPEFTDNMTDDQKMAICKEVFDRLNDDNHPVKINLEKMKEIKEIRIIEGLEK